MLRRIRLSVLDLLILIAATAPGLALTRGLPRFLAVETRISVTRTISVLPGGSSSWSGLGWLDNWGRAFTTAGRPLERRPSYWLIHVPYWSGPCLATWTLAVMALSLGRIAGEPQPRIARPGVGVGLALGLASATILIECVRFSIINQGSLRLLMELPELYRCHLWAILPTRMAYTVAASWLVLALSGHRPGGVGGRGVLALILGGCWIAAGLTSQGDCTHKSFAGNDLKNLSAEKTPKSTTRIDASQ